MHKDCAARPWARKPPSTRLGVAAVPVAWASALDDPGAIGPSFTLDKPGGYFVQLVVSDGQQARAPEAVTIVSGNSRPLADAGPDRSVPSGAAVQLGGSASSNPDGDPLGWRWALLARPAGSVAALSDPAAVNPSFTADVLGDTSPS